MELFSENYMILQVSPEFILSNIIFKKKTYFLYKNNF
jgi:hypothetical protein